MRFLLSFFLLASIASATPRNFDIPSQTASEALLAFTRQADTDVLFSFDDLSKVKSTAVNGLHEPDDAIKQLLHNTGFSAHRNAQGKFTVSLLVCRRPTPDSASSAKYKNSRIKPPPVLD